MSILLSKPPYAERDERRFAEELTLLTRHHMEGCPAYRRIWAQWHDTGRMEDMPFLHVGLFKHLDLKTQAEGIQHERELHSSSTGGRSSHIALDTKSSALQAESSRLILEDAVGPAQRPLLILDSTKSLRRRGEMSARLAAALSLKPLSSEIHFLLDDPDDPSSMKWEALEAVLQAHTSFLVYGFSWILWLAWASAEKPAAIRSALAGKTFHFVHSGGWKKLEAVRVERGRFDAGLLDILAADSRVVDYYGLVEQVGIPYPLCEHGYRHVPRWADVFVRDSCSFESVVNHPGQLQLLNVLAYGAPYHNVLTEDLAIVHEGPCECGRAGKRFTLLGRLPKAEVRGCANV